MFERKPEIDAMVDRICQECASLGRGDVIPLALIESLSGVLRYTLHWSSIINKLKNRFLNERHVELWPVRGGEAYKLSTWREQLHTNNERRQRRATRQLFRATKALEALPAEELSDHQKTLRAAKIESLRRSRRAALRELRTQQVMSQPTQGNPRRAR